MRVAMEDLPRRHGITVDEYYRMAETGELAPDARVELIEGEIIDMPPIGSSHGSMDTKLTLMLVEAVAKRALVRCGLPIRLDNMSEPQPDFALVLPRVDFYEASHPTAADTLLAIEVSDTRLSFDLGRKKAMYAKHGIRELWVIDLKRARLHIFRQPSDGTFADVSLLEAPDTMTIERLPGILLDLSRLWRR